MNAVDCTLLTKRQAASMLKMCVRTLERLMAAGEFPQPVRFTKRCVWVPLSDIEQFLERKLHCRNPGRK